MTTFDPQRTPVDYIWLDGDRSPGTARVRGAADRRKWDVQVGPYMSGGITIFRGREISKFCVDIYLLSAQDWIDWRAWRKRWLARPPFGSRPKAMRIAHPWLAELEIIAVQVEAVSQPEQDDETGGYVVTIDFLEFRQPKIALAKPVAAGAEVDNDPYSKLIREQSAAIAAELAKNPI